MNILFATDGSGPARAGEKTIAALFDRDASKLKVLTVAYTAPYEVMLPDAGYTYTRLDLPVSDPEHTARQAAERLGAAGFDATSIFTRGDPSSEILDELEKGDYDLVVMGGSHTTWLGNTLLGSVSMHVVHHAPTSVLVAHRAPAGAGKVLVGADGSEGAGWAMDAAARVLDTKRCEIEVATVVSRPVAYATYPPIPFTGHVPDYQTLERQHVEQGRRTARVACGRFAANGFGVEEVVLVGSAGPQLLKEAENVGADLVVVGSRGLGAVRRTLLGSVGDQVLRHAPATLIGRKPRS